MSFPAPTSVADAIDDLLPQTQCGRCGYAGCRPYAEAVAIAAAPINRCPPGGDSTIAALASLLSVPAVALDPAVGPTQSFARARIDETTCIGCTLCIQACPVDAIVGAAKLMHTVLAERCTGCELCLPPCPVDCIAMIPAGREWTRADATLARSRHEQRTYRLAHPVSRSADRVPRVADTVTGAQQRTPAENARQRRRASVAAALSRARARRNDPRPPTK